MRGRDRAGAVVRGRRAAAAAGPEPPAEVGRPLLGPGGTPLGVVRAAIAHREGRMLGLEVARPDGVSAFLPWAALTREAGELRAQPIHLLGRDVLEFYLRHGIRLGPPAPLRATGTTSPATPVYPGAGAGNVPLMSRGQLLVPRLEPETRSAHATTRPAGRG